jgi:hypothetical protein
MKIDLGRLIVERLIVHEVPTRPARGDGPKPVLSEIDSPLTPELRNYFKERIVGSLTTAAYDVVFDPASGSPVPGLVTEYLGDGRSFVAKSVAIAQHLYPDGREPSRPSRSSKGRCSEPTRVSDSQT